MKKLDALLLYGSRARGDGGKSSDVDLLGVIDGVDIEKPYDDKGVSLHLYPFRWLHTQAKCGSLFMLHIVKEAVAITDPNHLLSELRQSFRLKSSYKSEIDLGCGIIAAFSALDDESISPSLVRRYFWGLRTTLMAISAQTGDPVFSANELERQTKLVGLASHIANRENASIESCKEMGRRVYKQALGRNLKLDDKSVSENLMFIFNLGGVATATAGEIIYDIRF